MFRAIRAAYSHEQTIAPGIRCLFCLCLFFILMKRIFSSLVLYLWTLQEIWIRTSVVWAHLPYAQNAQIYINYSKYSFDPLDKQLY